MKVSDTKIHYTETKAFANFEVTPALLQNITEFKEIALSHAARAYNADVLVGLEKQIKYAGDGTIESVTVTGYPAKYVNFRSPGDDYLREVAKGAQPASNAAATPQVGGIFGALKLKK